MLWIKSAAPRFETHVTKVLGAVGDFGLNTDISFGLYGYEIIVGVIVGKVICVVYNHPIARSF